MNRSTRLYLAWVVALVATLGSLYLSEVLRYQPCILCWFQRVAMYPQALLLGIAAFHGDEDIPRYAIPLASLGLAVALEQNAEDWGLIPVMRVCSPDAGAVPCNTMWPLWSQTFGEGAAALNSILTIPVLSMTAFILIIALLAWPRRQAVPAPAAYTDPHDHA